LSDAKPQNPASSGSTGEVITKNLVAGDHIAIFAPNATFMVERFVIGVGLSVSDIDTIQGNNNIS
jgi:hypothetical protein